MFSEDDGVLDDVQFFDDSLEFLSVQSGGDFNKGFQGLGRFKLGEGLANFGLFSLEKTLVRSGVFEQLVEDIDDFVEGGDSLGVSGLSGVEGCNIIISGSFNELFSL